MICCLQNQYSVQAELNSLIKGKLASKTDNDLHMKFS